MVYEVKVSAFVEKLVYVQASSEEEASELAKEAFNDKDNIVIDVTDMCVEDIEGIDYEE